MSLLRRVIGGVLRRLRQRQGRTLRDVAQAAGVSMPYLSEIERGRKEASSEVLAAICRALGIRLSDLLEEARDDLRRVERHEPVGSAPARFDRVPLSRAESAGPRVRIGFHADGPTAYAARPVTAGGVSLPLPARAPERLLHVAGTPGTIGSARTGGPAGWAGTPLTASGLRVRLIPSAPTGRPGARTARILARRRARTGRRRLSAR
ncbi:helix-turn-helix transcriptional regulator [Micromonospora sp. NPDC047707]|uniref:helix-turn-helix domain-containing protein n=1 Tax=Micromonospora sp. NPDC047707 TaxID=3154498 RepID=UPI0034517B1C